MLNVMEEHQVRRVPVISEHQRSESSPKPTSPTLPGTIVQFRQGNPLLALIFAISDLGSSISTRKTSASIGRYPMRDAIPQADRQFGERPLERCW